MSNTSSRGQKVLRFVGGEIAAKRRERGMSQEDLSWLSGMHRTSLGRIEGGSSNTSIVALSYLYFQLDCRKVIVDRCGIVPELVLNGKPSPQPVLTELRPSTMVRLLGDLVRERRRDFGLSLEEIARISGLHINSIWNFETGLVCPTITTYFSLLRSLEVAEVGHCSGTPILR